MSSLDTQEHHGQRNYSPLISMRRNVSDGSHQTHAVSSGMLGMRLRRTTPLSKHSSAWHPETCERSGFDRATIGELPRSAHGVSDHQDHVGLMSVALIPSCSLTVLGKQDVQDGVLHGFLRPRKVHRGY
jgi:hypothetical protein